MQISVILLTHRTGRSCEPVNMRTMHVTPMDESNQQGKAAACDRIALLRTKRDTNGGNIEKNKHLHQFYCRASQRASG